jgi:predicted ribosome quality control (RQC) complex YloA/Tae2 family protein
MHFNYHFLKFLCPELNALFSGMEVITCFSQNKDELVIGCIKNERELFIRANLLPVISCLAFPSSFKRGKKNTVSLFPEIIGQKIYDIKACKYERAMKIFLDSGDILVFKLHGTRSNVLLYLKNQNLPQKLFRNELKDDRNLNFLDLEKNFPIDFERFKALEGNASKFLPTLGKIPREWLKQKGYIEANLQDKWKYLNELLDLLETPHYYIFEENKEHFLTLLPIQNPVFETSDPVHANNELFRYKVVVQAFEKEKSYWNRYFEEQIKKTLSYLDKTKSKLIGLEIESPPSQVADVIMANLHQIPQGAESVQLFNFYTQKEEIIKLKPGIAPQKYAENLYRKSKNRKRELEQLQQNINDKKVLLKKAKSLLEDLIEINHFRELKEFVKKNHLIHQQKEKEEQVPFKKFEIEGYDVLVGKSAKGNDELLRRFAWKEDLWLHAKDVAGSHVLVKFRSGTNFPKNVIERAAELAAYYSKNKNESLAPVIYTPSKFVRKVKGSAPGAVIVDKESVIMVPPKGPSQTDHQ